VGLDDISIPIGARCMSGIGREGVRFGVGQWLR
jgi:hypothetical protein